MMKTSNVLLILLLLLSYPLMAQQSRGFDATHYLIENKYPLDTIQLRYDNKSFLNNTFFSVGAGLTRELSPSISRAPFRKTLGPTVFITVGKWFTDISGLRVGLNVGYAPTISSGSSTVKVSRVGLSADYLWDITSIANVRTNRLFSLIGTVGAGYYYSFNSSSTDHKASHNLGLSLGLQGRFRLSEDLSIYIEPQITAYTDQSNFHKRRLGYDPEAALKVGLIMHTLPQSERALSEPAMVRERLVNNLFITTGVGMSIGYLNYGFNYLSPKFNIGVGKFFSKESGLRLSATASQTLPGYQKLFMAGLSADYLLNLSSLVSGYDPNRIFEVLATVGPGLYYTNIGNKSGLSVGFNVGAQAKFNVSPMVDIFAEPRLSLLQRNYFTPGSGRSSWNLGAEVMVGVNLKATDYTDPRTNDIFSPKRFADNLFVSLSGGVSTLFKRQDLAYLGGVAHIAVGKWFTPASGLRLSAETSIYRDPSLLGLSFGADYLLNLSTLFSGYRQDRLFEVVASAGVGVAFSATKQDKRVTPLVQVGLQGKFQVLPSLDLFLEPRLTAHTYSYIMSNSQDVLLSPNLLIGATYYPGLGHTVRKGQNKKTGDSSEMVVTLGVAPQAMFYPSTVNGLSIREYVGLGGWFDHVSGMRVGLEHVYSFQQPFNSIGVSADYLLNLTNAFRGYQQGRVFNLVGALGAGASYSFNANKREFTPSVNASLQANFRLSEWLDFYLEPRASFMYGDYDLTSGRMIKTAGSFSAGFHFKPQLPRKSNRSHDLLVQNKFSDQTFSTIALAGQGIFTPNKGLHYLSPMVYVGVGKWFSYHSGLRVGIEGAYSFEKSYSLASVGLSADYLCNFSALALGYKQDRIFEVIGTLGVAGYWSESGKKSRITPAVNLGLQGKFNVSRWIDIFVEPRLNGHFLNYTLSKSNNLDLGGTIMAGVHFKTPLSRDVTHDPFSNKKFSDNMFLVSGISAEAQLVNQGAHYLAGRINLGIGKWFNPISGMRLMVSSARSFEKKYPLTSHSFEVDYLLNFSSVFAGYRADRLFDVVGILGVAADYSLVKQQQRVTPSLHLGLQGKFNVSPMVDLFIEPQAVVHGFDYLQRGITKPSFSGAVMAGVNLKFGYSDDLQHDAFESKSFADNMFLTAGVGGQALFRDNSIHYLSPLGYIGVGKWFSPYSGLRLGVGVAGSLEPKYQLIATEVTADYMLNLSTAFSGYRANRLFDAVGVVGLGASFVTNGSKSMVTPSLKLALQGKFNINRHLDLFVEPFAKYHLDRYDLKQGSGIHIGVGALVGATYKF